MSTQRRAFTLGCAALVAAAACAVGPTAAYAVAPPPGYESADNRIPSPTYGGANEVVFATAGGPVRIGSFFDVFTELDRHAPPPEGPPLLDSFFDVFTELSIEAPGLTQTGVLQANGAISVARRPGLPPGEPVLFDTEMLAMNLAGGPLPPGVMIRESPTRPSLGRTTITDVGGGLYRIDSFFDVFTELSLDGGQTWNPADAPLHLVGGLPEPAAATLLGVAAVALAAYRRRLA